MTRPRLPGLQAASGIAVVAVVTLFVWAMSALALWMYAGRSRDPARRELVIPAGTADLVRAGENPLRIPAAWDFTTDDVLVLDNRDSSTHTIGGSSVGPGERREVVLRSSALSYVCTLLPSGTHSLTVSPRRGDWHLTILPTLLLGPPAGLVILGVRRLTSALGEPAPAQA